jgi:2'-5' RNA ligase
VPFPIVVQGAGSFGRAAGRSKVVWLGLDPDGRAAVASLAIDVGAALEGLPLEGAGLRSEPLRIHLTVARRAPDDLPDRVGVAVGEGPTIGWLADRMRLYRSHLEAAGPRHESLWTGRFGRAPVRPGPGDGR